MSGGIKGLGVMDSMRNVHPASHLMLGINMTGLLMSFSRTQT